MLQWLEVTLVIPIDCGRYQITQKPSFLVAFLLMQSVGCAWTSYNNKAGNDLDSNGDIVLYLFKLLCEMQTFPLPSSPEL